MDIYLRKKLLGLGVEEVKQCWKPRSKRKWMSTEGQKVGLLSDRNWVKEENTAMFYFARGKAKCHAKFKNSKWHDQRKVQFVLFSEQNRGTGQRNMSKRGMNG